MDKIGLFLVGGVVSPWYFISYSRSAGDNQGTVIGCTSPGYFLVPTNSLEIFPPPVNLINLLYQYALT